MQKAFRDVAEKMLLPVSASFVLLLTGCGGTMGDKDTDEAKQYEAQMALDAGDYDKAIAMLEKDCAGFGYEDCQLNLGSAYLGKAGMDIISLGKDLIRIDDNESFAATDTWKDTQTMTVLFDIITDEAIKAGAKIYKNLLDQNGSECNGEEYDALTTNQKNACIAVNPILLQEILSEDETKTDLAVDIETIAQFKDVLNAVSPGISTAEIVSVLDNSAPAAEKDVNSNEDVDSMEATDCAMKAYKTSTFDNTCTEDTSVSATDLGEVDFTNVTETLYGVDVDVTSNRTGYDDASFTRLVTEVSTGVYTTVTTDGYCELDGETTCTEGDSGCYPCPTFNADGSLATLDDTVTDILNNDTLLTSIAIMSDSSDTDSDTKVQEFKDDICYDDTNTFICQGTASDPVITQDALLDYMAQQ